jgi:DNA invertase Pin-like site-specific DNA recombinase
MQPMNTKKTQPAAPQRFIAYYRVSTAKQGQSGLGLDAQRDRVQQFLKGSAGFPPLAEFVEEESGRKVDRPALAAALAACRVRGATLIIAKLDRLARNQRFLMELVDSGTEVLFCDFPQIPAGAAGRFMLQQMAAVAELEAGLISERTKAALRAKVARDGQWDRKAAHHLRPGVGQKAAAAAVKAAADARAADLLGHLQGLRAEGVTSLAAHAKHLNEAGIPTPRGGQWTATAVSRVLQRAQVLKAVNEAPAG